MRRILVLLCTFASALGLLVGAGGPASAASGVPAVSLADHNCNHFSDGGSGAIVAGGAHYVQLNGTGAAIGSAQLCSHGSLFWGYVVFYNPMPAGKWGRAVLEIDRDGLGGPVSRWSCDSPVGDFRAPNGANRFVEQGQTRCWTPKIQANVTVDWIRVVGNRANYPHPEGSWDAWGYGAWK